MEPFTTYNKIFQGGKFDKADRLFDSISKTWKGVYKSTSDVKELIPEFYYFPDFLTNKNKLDLGTTQDNRKIDNVILPNWAENSEIKFVQIMRKAFESEYVSRNLHNWIDLIFGFKQRGTEAELAYNVFHPYTYEGSIDIDKIEDEQEKKAILSQISEYGQTPKQLFDKGHIMRKKGNEIMTNILESKSIKLYHINKLSNNNGIIKLIWFGKYIVTILDDMTILKNKFDNLTLNIISSKKFAKKYATLNYKSMNSLNSLEKLNNSNNNDGIKGHIIIQGKQFLKQLNKSFSKKMVDYRKAGIIVGTKDLKHLIIAGFADASFIVYDIQSGRKVQEIREHEQLITALAIDEHKSKMILVTGSVDKTVMIWKQKRNANKKHRKALSANYLKKEDNNNDIYQILNNKPVCILDNVNGIVTAIDVSIKNNIISFCCRNGRLFIYSLANYQLIHKINPYADINSDDIRAFSIVKINDIGNIMIYSYQTTNLFLYSSNNGKLLSYIKTNEKYNDIKFSKKGNQLICGGINKKTIIYKTDKQYIFTQHKILNDSQNIINSIAMDDDETTVLVGTNNGQCLIYSFPEKHGKKMIKG